MVKEKDHRVGWVDGDDVDDDMGMVMLECAGVCGVHPPLVHYTNSSTSTTLLFPTTNSLHLHCIHYFLSINIQQLA